MAVTDKNLLKDYLKKRLDKKEVKNVYGYNIPGSRRFADSTRESIKKRIEFGEITTTDEIDEVIEDSRNEYKKHLEEVNERAKEHRDIRKLRKEEKRKQKETREEEKRRIKEEPKYRVIYRPPVGTKKTVTYTPIDWKGLKRTNNTIAGGIVFGPVGAAAGYALSDKPEEPKIKTKVVSDHGYIKKNCHVEINDDKLKFSFTMGLIKHKTYQFIRFNEIGSTDLRNSTILDIELNDNSKFTFVQKGSSLHGIPPKYRSYTKDLYKKLESALKEYESKNKSNLMESKPTERESKPKNLPTEKDPIDQIKELNDLKESGIITNDEFEDKKKKLLERI